MPKQPISKNQIPPQSSTSYNAQTKNSTGFGIAAFICGLVSLFASYAGLLFAIAAIVLFFVQKNKHGSTGLSVAGLVLGIISLIALPVMIIGSLSYFGAIEPSRFLPDKCIFSAGFGGCTEFGFQGSDATFSLINNVGDDITITSIAATNTGNGKSCNPMVTAQTMDWKSSSQNKFTVTGCQVSAGDRAQLNISISFYTLHGSQFNRMLSGTIAIKKV